MPLADIIAPMDAIAGKDSPRLFAFPADSNDSETIVGGNSADTVNGMGGDDVILGKQGADSVKGSTGDDTIKGGAEGDTVAGGDGNDRVIGGRGDDRLIGGENDDRLSGGRGADTVSGGAGDNTLSGGAGADVFYFSAASAGVTKVQDFDIAKDQLNLDGVAGTFYVETEGGVTVSLDNGGSVSFAGLTAAEIIDFFGF